MGSHSGLRRHKSPEEKKDHLLIPKARAAENGMGWGGARESEQDVLSCARLLWAHQGGGWKHSGSVLSYLVPCAAGLTWQLSCKPSSPLLPWLPGTRLPLLWGKSAPRRYTGPSQAPWVSGEMADQMVGNGGQPKAETKITQREKKEESMKQKQQGKFLHLTPTVAYLHSPRKSSVIQSPVP